MMLLSSGLLGLALAVLPAPQESTAPDLRFRIELVREPELRVHVEFELEGDADGTTDLTVVEGWGGVRTAGERLTDLVVTDGAGEACSIERPAPSRFEVTHAPSARLSGSYTLTANTAPPSFPEDNYYEPVLLPDRLHVFGNQGLLLPQHLVESEPRRIELAWTGFAEAGWSVITSFGAGTDARIYDLSLRELRHALYTAGALRVVTREVRGRPVHVAIHGSDWAFTDDDLADLAELIVTVERSFFDDWDHPYFLISVLPVEGHGGGSVSMGGTALTQTFALFLQPGAGIEPPAREGHRVPWLLAHEMFHDWNGLLIRMGENEVAQYWFQEGFTNFYARRLLLRGGLIEAAAYVEDLNTQLRAYYTSPFHSEPNDRIVSDFWTVPEIGLLPYERGDAVALYVDHAIRTRTEGAQSLDDWMLELYAKASEPEAQPVSTESLLADIERWCGTEAAAHLRSVIVDGATLELPETPFGSCLELVWTAEPTFDLGFDFEASKVDHVVHAVLEGSPAWDAGLRNGQKLMSWSIEGRRPDQAVRLEIELDGQVVDVTYMPRGSERRVPRFELTGDGLESACEAL